MAENVEASETASRARAQLSRRGLLRRVIYPILVIVAIVGVIWWLEHRTDSAVSPTGERYGPSDLPATLVPAGADIAPEEGKLAPDFLLESLDGGDLRLSDFRGRPVVLNFWATWCAPCRKEMPQFVRIYDHYKDEGLMVLAVNLQEGKSVVSPFAKDFGMNFPIGIDRGGDVGDEYDLLGLPTTYFIGRDGLIRSVFTGPFIEKSGDTNVQGAIEAGELEQRIAGIMSVPAATGSGH